MRADPDVIGSWTEVKLDILRDYAAPYSKILEAKGFYHLYIDAHASGGLHRSRRTGEAVDGSARIAIQTKPPFSEYHFIEADASRVDQLKSYIGDRADVYVHHGDCNRVLLSEVFPRARYEDRRRALCLLDPYNLDLTWEVLATAGKMKSIEVFVNFMVMDMNMNILLRDPAKASSKQKDRMNRFWGDQSWRDVVYEVSPQGHLFDETEEVKVEAANEKISLAYRKRLIDVAGFAYAAQPLRFVNSIHKTIYYLFFASPNPTGERIVDDILRKHRRKQRL